jgi:hypothetical protein
MVRRSNNYMVALPGVIVRLFGAQVSDEDLEDIIAENNTTGDGVIDFTVRHW